MDITINDEEYSRGVDENKFSVIGRLQLIRGGPLVSTLGKKEKLAVFWGIQNFKVVPIGRGYYHFKLHSMGNQSKVMSMGVMEFKPCILIVARWVQNFNPEVQ